jgi:hypothetical protein
MLLAIEKMNLSHPRIAEFDIENLVSSQKVDFLLNLLENKLNTPHLTDQSLKECLDIFDSINKLKVEHINLYYDYKNKKLEHRRKKIDLNLYIILKVIQILVGIVLSIVSIYVLPNNVWLGGLLLGTGLGTFGVNVVTIKSILKK